MIGLWACLSAALAIVAGAFGAHGAKSAEAAEWLRTGGLYQLVHGVGALALITALPGARWPAALLLIGGAIFGGTLYAMALGGPRWLGAVTPVGGTLMIIGWLWAAGIFLSQRGAA